MKRKKTILAIGAIMLLALLSACTLLPPTQSSENLRVAVTPLEGGYPPLNVTLTVYAPQGETGGQYSFELDGKTYQQGGNVLKVIVNNLPCLGRVVWEKEGQVPQEAMFEIPLINSGPVICPPRLNGIDNAWYLHPRYRYVVDFPGTYDPEGGPVKLVAATVRAELKDVDDTIYTPPYEGPNVFHAKLFGSYGGHIIENAFAFHCLWTAPLDTGFDNPEWVKGTRYIIENQVNADGSAYKCVSNHKATMGNRPGTGTNWRNCWKYIGTEQGTNLPFSPPGYGESGYPGSHCFEYDKTKRPSQMTEITATFEDEMGARTTESWLVPTGADPGCNIYDNL